MKRLVIGILAFGVVGWLIIRILFNPYFWPLVGTTDDIQFRKFLAGDLCAKIPKGLSLKAGLEIFTQSGFRFDGPISNEGNIVRILYRGQSGFMEVVRIYKLTLNSDDLITNCAFIDGYTYF